MRLVALAVALAACRSQDATLPTDGGVAAIDAPGDAPAADASLYAIAIDTPMVTAVATQHHAVSITGPAGTTLILGTDRATAGTVAPTVVMLDATGSATAQLTPCDSASTGCLGAAKLTLTGDPGPLLATAPFTLVASTTVGDVMPCMTTDNVLYVHDAATFQSAPADAWTVTLLPDQIELDVDGYRATFSLAQLHQALSPGTYEQAERPDNAALDHPGLAIDEPGLACNQVDGRFEIYDYTADPVHGDLTSVTISFEQSCDGSPAILSGCVHYATTPPTYPPPPPAPDPTKVSVQVLSTARDGTPDLTASAIFRDSSGVVLDTTVDAYGEAQAALQSGGELTVIEHAGGAELIHTYRPVHAGDHVVVNPGVAATGAKDLMLAHFTPPVDANGISLFTGCGGGSWGSPSAPATDLAFYDGCRAPTFSMLTVASGTSGREFVWQTGLTHYANGDVAVPDVWVPYGTATVQLNNIPASSPQLHTTWSTQVDMGVMLMDSNLDASPAAGSDTVSLQYAPGAGTGTIVEVDIGDGYGLTSESRTIVESGAPSNVIVDFATQPLLLVSAIQQTATGATWSQSGASASTRTLIWRAAMQTGVHVTWILVEQISGTPGTTLPALPFAHAGEDPTIDASAELFGTSVAHVAYDTVTGFALAPPTGAYHAHASTTETIEMRQPF